MVQLCPQANCTASYQLDDADEGKTFRCEKCGSLLVFESDGLSLLSAAPSNSTEIPSRSISFGKQEKKEMLSPSNEPQSMAGLVFSVVLAFLFAAGSSLVVLFFFLPLIDQASVSRQYARIEEGDRHQKRQDDRLWNRVRNPDNFDRDRRFPDKDRVKERFDNPPIDVPVQPNEDAQKKRQNERKEWEKTRDKLDGDVEESRTNARGRMYFYTWGMLVGFLILGVASVGFLSFGPTNARRIFGGIVISAEILLIFLAYFVAYNSMRFRDF